MGTKAKLSVIAVLMSGIVGLLIWSKNGDRKKPVIPAAGMPGAAGGMEGGLAEPPARFGTESADPHHAPVTPEDTGMRTELAGGNPNPPPVDPVVVRPDPPAPTAQKYTVAAGDSLWVIAKKVYGKGTEGRRIFEANRDKMSSEDDLLKVGTTLTIPPLPESTRTPVPEVADVPRPPVPATDTVVTVPAKTGTYKVKSGDTLSSIAKAVLGDPNKWTAIYKANKEKLPHPDTLVEGMELVIP